MVTLNYFALKQVGKFASMVRERGSGTRLAICCTPLFEVPVVCIEHAVERTRKIEVLLSRL